MDVKTLIDQYLNEQKVMQLATVFNGKPWVCTVNFAIDESHNLYWMSLRSAHHSQHIQASPFVAVCIVRDADKGQGLQFEGAAEEVKPEEALNANAIYEKRYGHKKERQEEAQSGDREKRAYYRVQPKKIILFDKVNFPDNPRQEFVL